MAALQLRGGTGSTNFLIAASAVKAYRDSQSDSGPVFRTFKTKRAMRSKIVRGKLGASLRGQIGFTKLTRDE
jgi:hypothetical protein